MSGLLEMFLVLARDVFIYYLVPATVLIEAGNILFTQQEDLLMLTRKLQAICWASRKSTEVYLLPRKPQDRCGYPRKPQ
jgi:hypothetical protein